MSFTMGILKLLRLCFIIEFTTCPVLSAFRSPVGSDVFPYDTSLGSWQIGPEFHRFPMEVPRIQVSCTGSQLSLLVEKRFNGVLLSAEDWQLGDDCFHNGYSEENLVFTYDFALCGTNHVVNQNGLDVFYNLLHFVPRSPLTQWQAPFTVPISCVPNRSHRRPLEFPFSIPLPSTKTDWGYAINAMNPSMKTDWSFAINAMNPSWTNTAESNLYQRGQSIHLEVLAKCGTDQRPFIQSCWLSSSISPETRPQHAVILNKGCTATSRSSHTTMAQFVPSGRKDAVNFILDSLRLKSGVYIHCSVVVSDQGITEGSKACNYNTSQSRWEELSGNVAVCNCCRFKCKDHTNRNSHTAAMALVSTGPFIINGPMRSHPPAPQFERRYRPPASEHMVRSHPPAPQPKVRSHPPAPDADPSSNHVDFMQSDEPAAEGTKYHPSTSQPASGAKEGTISSENAISGPRWLPVPADASVSSQEDPAARLSLPDLVLVTLKDELDKMPHALPQLSTNDVAKLNPTATHYNLHQRPPLKGLSGKRFNVISDTVKNGVPLMPDGLLIPILDGWPIPPPPMLYGWPIPPPYHEMAARREEGLKRRELALRTMREESQRKQALREREESLREETRRNQEWGRRSRMPDSRAPQEGNKPWPQWPAYDLSQRGSGLALKMDRQADAELGTTAGVQPILRRKLQFATDADGSQTLSYEEETKPGDGNGMTKTLVKDEDVVEKRAVTMKDEDVVEKRAVTMKDEDVVEKRAVTGRGRLLAMFLDLMRKLDKRE